MQYVGAGDGRDGDKVVTGTEDINDRTSFSISAGSAVAAVADSSDFAQGDICKAHKSKGNTTTACGTWEYLQVLSVDSATQITFTTKAVNSYQDSGTDQSQLVRVPQYRSLTIEVGGAIVPAGWDGDKGGITAFLCQGEVVVEGTISVAGGSGATSGPGGGATATTTVGGFRGGYGSSGAEGGTIAQQGEGVTGGLGNSASAGGTTGGGAADGDGSDRGNGATGGGGGHTSAGGSGSTSSGSSGTHTAGSGSGVASDSADLTIAVFGGGAGGSIWETGAVGSAGASGGGFLSIVAGKVTVTGSITANGGNGNSVQIPGSAGAGGSILIKAREVVGANLITAIGGTAGSDGVVGAANGGTGKIRIESCSDPSGNTNPAASESIGGHAFCSSLASIVG